ncbi:MAG: glycosyltransferase [Clostridia bacterium]|nr:glycosyltransferase [Clostridia bacterium]
MTTKLNEQPVVSIVTVCYNEQHTIRNVMDSVLAQTYTNFEYIIQDGDSTDETKTIISSYQEKFRQAGIPLYVYSEKDQGIYDAMNKAVTHCNGLWINFMNADDRFANPNVLDAIFCNRAYDQVSLLYGDAVELEFGEAYLFTKCPERIEERMPFSHQSVFVRKELLLKYPFNLQYRIGADYDFLLTLYQKGACFEDVGLNVCIISKDGLSSVNLYDTFVESVNIRKEHGIQQYSDTVYQKKLRALKIKQFGMDHFPIFLKKYIRKVQRILRGQNHKMQERIKE